MNDKVDRRGILDEGVFTCRITKDKKVWISWYGKLVTVLSGRKAEDLIVSLENANAKEAQLLMAKATGHFKHGNERTDRQR